MGSYFLRVTVLCISGLLLSSFLFAQDLSLSPNDLHIELRSDGGYHLFIRTKPDVGSVLLTETTRDPQFRADNYAYRTLERNPVNGDEIRILDGKPISKDSGIYSLISSTPERHPVLGWAYHIYIPHILYYGYEGGRHGEVQVGDGTYLNIRTFYYAYADYRGPFKDNPYMLRITQDPWPETVSGTYMKETVDSFTEIAGENTIYLKNPSGLVEQIEDILNKNKSRDIDIVICLDATGSMKPYFDVIRPQLVPMLQKHIGKFDAFRIGIVFFKDYRDEYLNKIVPFTDNFEVLRQNLDTVKVNGGGDIPEAVYEALYAGASKFNWTAESKIMILIGDAPPHPRPRGAITKEMVNMEIARQGITVHAIILPYHQSIMNR